MLKLDDPKLMLVNAASRSAEFSTVRTFRERPFFQLVWVSMIQRMLVYRGEVEIFTLYSLSVLRFSAMRSASLDWFSRLGA